MILAQDVEDFIERKHNIRLLDFQRRILENMVCGKTTLAPRCCGMSMLIKGYAEYLEGFYTRRAAGDETVQYDDVITGYEVARTGLLSAAIMKEQAQSAARCGRQHVFERDYVVKVDDLLGNNAFL